MEKRIKGIIIALICLAAFFEIGHYNGVRRMEKKSLHLDWKAVSYEGDQETEDTPWHITAGTIEVDGRGKCIFLMSGTGVTIGEVAMKEKLLLEYRIHPWVYEGSDGAGLLIRVMDKDGAVLHEQGESVSTEDAWTELSLDLSGYETAESVTIFCNSDETGNADCDWVIIQ